MNYIFSFFSAIMAISYKLTSNYGLSIIIFTIIFKLITLPISIWQQKNQIKMVKMLPELNKIKIDHFGDKETIEELQQEAYKKNKYNAFVSVVPPIIQIAILLGVISVIRSDIGSGLYNTEFLSFDLGLVPIEAKGKLLLIPLLSGLSSLLLGIYQSKANVLQNSQSKLSQILTSGVSVAISLFLGLYVPAGVVLYWIVSNILSIVVQAILNIIINPKKYVDYEELEKSQKELDRLNNLDNQKQRSKEEIQKEKNDYKKFFNVLNKHLVFYSESNGFYKYFKGVIEYILENSNITIHYITGDYNDKIFELEKNNPRIRAYYIGEKKLMTLMMKMEADIVVMTMPDLNNYHIKKSYVDKDINYIFIPHSIGSLNLTMRYKSMDNYQTVFAAGKDQKQELEKENEVYKIENRNVVEVGYPLLDDMINNYDEIENNKKTVLIAPSWQKDNIVDLCLDELLEQLVKKDYEIIVRPHPQHVRHMSEKFEQLKDKYKNNSNIDIQTDFTSNSVVFNADLIITDWSSIGLEYAFTTLKPVLYINTPMKVMNDHYKEINDNPFIVWIREKIGIVVEPNELNDIDKHVDELLENKDSYHQRIKEVRDEYIYNVGNSSEVAGNYIIDYLVNKAEERKTRS